VWDFFLYFPAQARAESAAAGLRRAGYEVRVQAPSEGIEQWSVIASKHLHPLLGTGFADARMRLVALRHGGEFDGHGASMAP
jgi:hypothetical protein